MKKRLVQVLVLGMLFMFSCGPYLADRSSNRTVRTDGYRIHPHHEKLEVADMHADSLLWGRDLVQRSHHGHVDVPRLIEANVALQGFFLVTHTPRGLNIYRNDDSTDNIGLLAFFGRWPVATWGSTKARALYQAARLRDVEARSAGKFTLITSRSELASYRSRRTKDPRLTAGFLGVEGAHCLEGNVAAVDELFAAGIRVVAPTHFFDTFLGGSASGVARGGLTSAGRELVTKLEEKRMFVDLAHASPAVIKDVLAMAKRPVLVSHTGVRGTCDNPRNLSDDELRGVAKTGGVAGIGFFDSAVCGTDWASVVRACKHAIAVAGVDHVALGSDFDGAVRTETDVRGLGELTGALLAAGLSEADVAKVMGGNVVRVLAAGLP